MQVLEPRDYPRWRDALRQMPLALTIETEFGPIGVVHAEAPHPDWSIAIELLEKGSDDAVYDTILGFEEYTPDIRQMKRQPVQGLRALVSGHFVSEEVKVIANRWNLDTGAGFVNRNRLSLLEITASELESFTFDVGERS